jgi:hypothetical protein
MRDETRILRSGDFTVDVVRKGSLFRRLWAMLRPNWSYSVTIGSSMIITANHLTLRGELYVYDIIVVSWKDSLDDSGFMPVTVTTPEGGFNAD